MTDYWWLQQTDAAEIIASLRYWDHPFTDRKLRLFACACGRAELKGPGRLQRVIEVTERFVEGAASDAELIVAGRDGALDSSAFPQCIARLDAIWAATYTAGRPGVSESRRKIDADLLRCIAGEPGSRDTLDLAVLTPTVVALARAAYHERVMPSGELEPARLAVLADALEEAGCVHAGLLAHLREPGPHARGCWAVDEILGLR